MFVQSDRLGGGVEVSKLEQTVDSLNVPVDCGISRVVIEHELLHEACNDPLVSWLAAAWVLNAMLTDKIYVHSLPKSCGFSSRIRFKFGHFPVNNMSKSRQTSL
jgi:hypothetical protein